MTKHIVKTFSYPVEKNGVIDSIENMAKKENKSLSKIIIECLEDYQQKNGIVDVNPTNLNNQQPKIKTLDDYLIDLIKVDEFISDDNRTSNELIRMKGKMLGLSRKAEELVPLARKREREKLLNV